MLVLTALDIYYDIKIRRQRFRGNREFNQKTRRHIKWMILSPAWSRDNGVQSIFVYCDTDLLIVFLTYLS